MGSELRTFPGHREDFGNALPFHSVSPSFVKGILPSLFQETRNIRRRNDMRIRLGAVSICVLMMLAFTGRASAMQSTTRDIKIISSSGARALVDTCAEWAGKNKQIVAIAILDWGGNLIESHAMEGAPANAIDTALLKAKSALRWRRPTSETNRLVKTGENLAPTFMNDFPQPGALPIILNGQVIGAMGVSGADGEKCAQAAIDVVFKSQATTTGR
jgi:uncharacterized protein GlcG (DUF336 family)